MAEKTKNNVNTAGVNFYNSEPDYQVNSTLRTSMWNDRLVLSVFPKLDQPVEGKVFDYDKQMATFLQAGDVNTLKNILGNAIELAKNDTTYRAAIPTSKGMVEFGTKNEELGLETPYLNICEMDEDKKITASMLYMFKPALQIEDFSYNTGDYKLNRDEMGEVKQLLNVLESAEDALSYAYAHTVVDREKYAQEKLNNNIIKIMDKMGIPVEYTGRQSSGASTRKWDTAKVSTANKSLPSESVGSDVDAEDIYG